MKKITIFGIILIFFTGFAIADTEIRSPVSNQTVPRIVSVEGTTSGDGHIWLLVGPTKSPGDWWPQQAGDLHVTNDSFSGLAILGGERNEEFQIAVMQANESTNEKIMRWLKKCNASDYWPPITKEDAVTGVSIPEIEDDIVAKVLVKLGD